MGKLYVYAIGGSGSRVLRSLTMLLANGIVCKDEIVPMIIDPDYSNGDLERTTNLMSLYGEIHNSLLFSSNTTNKFFSTDISSFNKGEFLLPLIGTSGVNFENYIELSMMSRENQAFMRMLFSDTNLSSDMNVGFKGNPNIGSIVLNQFTQSQEFKAFENDFVQGDKVVIISSIFGGTGASGFPLLLKTLRTSSNTALSSAPIGAVTLLPYFSLKVNDKSAIQADSFITKAKAALNYYEKNVTGNGTLNDMYYLGDVLPSGGYENCDGGEDQQNDAHLIELLAALAVIDFSSKRHSGTNMTSFHEFGLNSTNAPQCVTFSDFGNKTLHLLRKPMTQFALMMSYLTNRDDSHMASQKWAKERNSLLGEEFLRTDFYGWLLGFKLQYEDWLSEMAKNKIAFKPFLDDKDITDVLNKINGMPECKYGYNPFAKKSYDLIDEKLSKNLSKIQQNISAPQAFMELFYIVTSELCSDKLKI